MHLALKQRQEVMKKIIQEESRYLRKYQNQSNENSNNRSNKKKKTKKKQRRRQKYLKGLGVKWETAYNRIQWKEIGLNAKNINSFET